MTGLRELASRSIGARGVSAAPLDRHPPCSCGSTTRWASRPTPDGSTEGVTLHSTTTVPSPVSVVALPHHTRGSPMTTEKVDRADTGAVTPPAASAPRFRWPAWPALPGRRGGADRRRDPVLVQLAARPLLVGRAAACQISPVVTALGHQHRVHLRERGRPGPQEPRGDQLGAGVRADCRRRPLRTKGVAPAPTALTTALGA